MHEQISHEEIQKVEMVKTMLLRKILSRPALERLARVKMVKPDVAAQLEMYLVDLYQSGKVKGEVSEEQMKMILETISGGARQQFKIVRK